MAEEKNISCSFCGRDKQDTQVLIAGINSHICDSCIQQATGIVEAEVEGNSGVVPPEVRGSDRSPLLVRKNAGDN